MSKTITICGSTALLPKLVELRTQLRELGFVVLMPEEDGRDVDFSSMSKEEQVDWKRGYVDLHIGKIKKADAILVANYEKKGKQNYIGANTFLEMGFAYILGKKIYVLSDIPDQPNTEEIEAMMPVVLGGDISKLSL